jgi:hypothetical protein
MSTPYHPQTDGLVERTNLTMKEMLRAFSHNGGRDWDQYLAAAEYVYNNTYNTSIKSTPFKLDTGQDPLDTHSDAVLKIVGQLADDSEFNYDDLATDFINNWDDSLKIAKQCISEATEVMKQRYDKFRMDMEANTIKVGSKVYLDGAHLKVVDTTGKLGARKTLDERRLGPYEVTEVLGNGTAFRLKLPAHQKFHDVQSISKLEIVRESREFPDAHVDNPFLPVIIMDQEEYEIELILRHKTVRGKRLFLVKYLGYDSSFNEWKHRSELSNATELVQQYELDQKLIGGPVRRSPRLTVDAQHLCSCNGPLLLGCTCGVLPNF